MKRMFALLTVVTLAMGLMVPAMGAAQTGTFEDEVEAQNDWANQCLDGEIVTISVTAYFEGSFTIDANGKVHVHWKTTLVEGTDTNGWTVTKYDVNQGHNNSNGFDWYEGNPALYNLHMEVSDPDPETNRAYNANFVVLMKNDGTMEVVAQNGTGNCLRWNT